MEINIDGIMGLILISIGLPILILCFYGNVFRRTNPVIWSLNLILSLLSLYIGMLMLLLNGVSF